MKGKFFWTTIIIMMLTATIFIQSTQKNGLESSKIMNFILHVPYSSNLWSNVAFGSAAKDPPPPPSQSSSSWIRPEPPEYNIIYIILYIILYYSPVYPPPQP